MTRLVFLRSLSWPIAVLKRQCQEMIELLLKKSWRRQTPDLLVCHVEYAVVHYALTLKP